MNLHNAGECTNDFGPKEPSHKLMLYQRDRLHIVAAVSVESCAEGPEWRVVASSCSLTQFAVKRAS